MTIERCYSDLIRIQSFEERLKYLMRFSKVGEETFGGLRWLNQQFYQSMDWKAAKKIVILRDKGNDLGVDDYPIHGSIYVHHIEPITYNDLMGRSSKLFDPENLISCSYQTHETIHYGKESFTREPIIRKPNDTCPWR